MEDLISEYTATDLLQLIANKDVSSFEILQLCIKQYETLNPSLNAIVETNFEDAIKCSYDIDRVSNKASNKLPFLPLPVGVKDLNDVRGLKTTYGSLLFQDNLASSDDDVVAQLRTASAIIFGKTNVPEHGFGATTTNPLQGSTGNPFDRNLSAGASTGGGASAVASGIVPLATGSDFAGSLRTPAAFCGIAGMRPSNGIVGTSRRSNIWSPFDVEGPLAKTAADCKLLLGAMAKSCSVDPFSKPVDDELLRPVRKIDLKNLNVAFSCDLGFAVMSNFYKRTFLSKIEKFTGLFASCEPGCIDLSNAYSTFMTLRSIGFLGDFGPMEKEFGAELGEVILRELELARQLSSENIAKAFLDHSQIVKNGDEFFNHVDLLITPASSVPPFKHEDKYPSEVDGKHYDGYLDWEAISWGITLTQCPAVVISCGKDENGMPFGIQIIAKQHKDAFLLDAAHSIETAFLGIEDLERPRPNLEKLAAIEAATLN